MKNKNIKKDKTEELDNLKKLSEKDMAFITRLFSEYISNKNISEIDVQRLSIAMRIKYPHIYSKIISIARNIFEQDIEEIKNNKELYEFFQELKSLYGLKLTESLIVDRWPKGLKLIEGHTTIELDDKKSINYITIYRNDDKILTLYQPFPVSIQLFEGIFSIINGSLKEMSDLKIPIKISKVKIEQIKKNISEFNKYIKQIK
ncbi:MAG: hypothetical protein MUO82_00380 [Candidatus Thermoplasmatota archaeon]|nr:hypothetical protein [Candidatus Thermoplasmatota archaeon]